MTTPCTSKASSNEVEVEATTAASDRTSNPMSGPMFALLLVAVCLDAFSLTLLATGVHP